MPDAIFSRLTWSKRGISAYDENGSFLFRLEGWMVGVMNDTIIVGLARIEKERIRRETYTPKPAENVAEDAAVAPI